MRKVSLVSPSAAKRSGNRLILAETGLLTAATGLTVTDYTNQRVFQRVGTSKSITVSGTYTGPASVIKARAVPHGTLLSSDAYAWTTVAIAPAGGTFSGSLTVTQGGWYNIQVCDGVNTSVRAGGSNKWGVGVIIAMAGQSNMYHLYTTNTSYPLGDPLCVDYDGAGWKRLGNINDSYPICTLWPSYGTYTTEGQRSDGIVNFANNLRASLNCPVATIAYAVTGSAISSWTGAGANWATLASRISAVGGDIEGAIWLQGESDASGTASAYKASLATLHAQFHTATGRDSSSFRFGIVTLGQGTAGWTSEGNMGKMRQAQIEYITDNAGAYYAGTPSDLSLSDSIHINGAGLSRLGKRYALAAYRALTANANVGKGPVISSASRSGSVITVSITHNGGTALQDGAGGSGSSLLGFRVFDGGSAATISSTAIVGNTVELTLSATPAGVVTLDYAMANVPFGTTVTASNVLYDNQSLPGESVGLPLRPHPLITVS